MRISLAAVRSRFYGYLRKLLNKTIDAYGHDADDSGTALCPKPRNDAEDIRLE